jgi:hypothetical protein
MTEHITKLNCAVGDLAITVNCNLPENLGNIVRIKSAIGHKGWGCTEDELFTWECEIATEAGWLLYETDGYVSTAKVGPVPDKYLRRLTPPQGYLMDEFADSEQLQMDFHQTDALENEIAKELAQDA